jgi:Holliday junction resolvase-like predicted endonuclease
MVSPEESIGPAKRWRLLAAARHLLAARPRLAARPVRFDVVAVTAADGDYNFRWLRDAFRS